MGSLRLLLAISVVLAHAGPLLGLTMIGGKMAVQSFFIISGFYMALILQEKYTGKYGSYSLYITNRFLRIFPLYWLVLSLTALFLIVFKNGLAEFFIMLSSFHPTTALYIILSNVFIFGQDFGMFLELNSQKQLFFSTAYEGVTPFIYLHQLVPQGWTLGVELSFYLLAPFLVKRKLWVIFIWLFLSFGLRFVLYANGLHHEPWTNRFFPTELVFFLLGILSYRIYRKMKSWSIPQLPVLVLFGYVLCFTLFFSLLPKMIGFIDLFQWLYYLSLCISIPFLFHFFKNSKRDAFLGELSYPVFISHYLIYTILLTFLPRELYHHLSILTITLSILSSVVLLAFVTPINKLRQKRVSGWQKKKKQ